jgi:hypothetical protein
VNQPRVNLDHVADQNRFDKTNPADIDRDAGCAAPTERNRCASFIDPFHHRAAMHLAEHVHIGWLSKKSQCRFSLSCHAVDAIISVEMNPDTQTDELFMFKAIQLRSESIETLCKQCFVNRLELFGSAASDKFNLALSDLDFLVTFLDDIPQGKRADSYFDLLFGLEDMFNRHVDLIEPKAIKNPFFLESVLESPKQIIYEQRREEILV